MLGVSRDNQVGRSTSLTCSQSKQRPWSPSLLVLRPCLNPSLIVTIINHMEIIRETLESSTQQYMNEAGSILLCRVTRYMVVPGLGGNENGFCLKHFTCLDRQKYSVNQIQNTIQNFISLKSHKVNTCVYMYNATYNNW